MYCRLQVVANIRKSEERSRQNPILFEPATNIRNKLKENSIKYSWIKQNTDLAKMPIQNKNDSSKQSKSIYANGEKLVMPEEDKSRKNKFWRNLNRQFETNIVHQSLELKRESAAFNKILAQLGKNNESAAKLKQNLKGILNETDSILQNRNQLRRDMTLIVKLKYRITLCLSPLPFV